MTDHNSTTGLPPDPLGVWFDAIPDEIRRKVSIADLMKLWRLANEAIQPRKGATVMNDTTKLLGVGSYVRWPARASLRGKVIAIDFDPDEPIAWIRRQDEMGNYNYHQAKVKELETDNER